MGATALAHLAVLRPGDHLVSSSWIYGGTQHLFDEELAGSGSTSPTSGPDQPRLWRKSVRKATRAIFVETPTNPLMRVVDLGPVAHVAREFGLALLVDATFASPINFRPLEHGADVAITSATKYLNGHSDVIAGAVAGSASFVEEVNRLMRLWGQAIDPHAAWLVDRGHADARAPDGAPQRQRRWRSREWARGACRRSRKVHYPGLAVPSRSRARQGGARRLRRHGRPRARRRPQGRRAAAQAAQAGHPRAQPRRRRDAGLASRGSPRTRASRPRTAPRSAFPTASSG